MAHKEQIDYMKKIKSRFPKYFRFFKNILDIGSYDVNGNNRYLFDFTCKYTGIDIYPGPNVDIVCKGHKFDAQDEEYDVIVSSECFEHDMYYKETIKNIIRMLKRGGLFLFTCASIGRPEHGTLRTTPEDSATTIAQLPEGAIWSNYYKNLSENDIKAIIDLNQIFKEFKFEVNKNSFDLYFYGIKKIEI